MLECSLVHDIALYAVLSSVTDLGINGIKRSGTVCQWIAPVCAGINDVLWSYVYGHCVCVTGDLSRFTKSNIFLTNPCNP